MVVDPSTTKFMIRASIRADGVIEKPDIIGAVFGQTEGLMGNELDLRDLQKSARIGRIEVEIEQKGGKTTGTILLPSAMDKVESAILAAGIESIDRIGPCKATIKVDKVEDTRIAKRRQVVDRAKELLATINSDSGQDSGKISDEVRAAVQVAELQHYPGTKLPAGPNVASSDSIILVEGRNDVLNLLKNGIKNAIGVEGTNVPKTIKDLSKEKTTIAFIDGDRGGELIARELLQTCDVDFVARAPPTREVEEIPHKLIMKCLKNKLTAEQFVSQLGIVIKKDDAEEEKEAPSRSRRGRRGGRGRKSDDKEDAPVADDKPAKEEKKPARRTRSKKADDDDGDEGTDDGDKGAEADEKPAPRKKALDPRAALRENLTELSGSLKAVLLDDKGAQLKGGLAVRELADTLKSGKEKVHSVVFDGVITQRLLDIAADKKIATVVGVKMGNVTKIPDTLEILTRDDLN
ncbi:MAG: DNA primase DnaG [Thermoplasmatota archaeon]